MKIKTWVLICFLSCGAVLSGWDYPTITAINSSNEPCLIEVDNGTVWKVEEGYPHGEVGDRLAIKKIKNKKVCFFNLESSEKIYCKLDGYLEKYTLQITAIDTNGYFIRLTDGSEWIISWFSSWDTCHWNLGENVLIWHQKDELWALFNLNYLISGSPHGVATNVKSIVWK